ncbi:hypothetical protein [Serratia marcescens]|uniref:hypothetical protein n=1 Tax=Serratia marcescens TaxID=615 RepID=UPI00215602FE|nr:hypothetical protein [Serratia marcescens]
MEQQEGIKRVLTVGEINLARSVFGRSVFYEKVFVHCDSYLLTEKSGLDKLCIRLIFPRPLQVSSMYLSTK